MIGMKHQISSAIVREIHRNQTWNDDIETLRRNNRHPVGVQIPELPYD